MVAYAVQFHFGAFSPHTMTIFTSARRLRDVIARQFLSALLAACAISAGVGCSKKSPSRVTEPAAGTVSMTVSGSGAGSGRVVSRPAGIDCTLSAGAVTGSCLAKFSLGSTVTLSTEPSTTSVFLACGGDCATSLCQTTMETPRAITATFVPNFLSVIANATSVGGGRIVSAPAGIDCALNGTAPGSGACSASFPIGTTVTLTQTPTSASVFSTWGAVCNGNPCTVAMSGQRTVEVTYRVPMPPGSIAISGFGTGAGSITSVPEGITCTVNAGVLSGVCSSAFAAGVSVMLQAVVADGSIFSGFNGACAGSTCNATTLSGVITTVGAGFASAPSAAILTLVAGPGSRGSGIVMSTPSGVNCTVTNGIASGVCSASFSANTVVQLTQTPNSPAIFQAWGGDCTGNPCLITMSQARNAEITYRLPPSGMITISGGGTGSGSVNSSPAGLSCTITAGLTSGICSAAFDAASTVTLNAAGSNNGSFDGYGGGCSGSACVLTISSGITTAVMANFTAAPQRLTVAPGAGSGGSGLVTSTPSGINCVLNGSTSSGTCTGFFAAGTLVTLSQSTSGHSVFREWGGDCAGNPCQVVMTQSRTALVVYQIQGVTVSGGGSGNGSVTSIPSGINCVVTAGIVSGSCSANFPVNTAVALTATASGLSSFSGYSGACAGLACTITTAPGVTSSVTAAFAAPPVLTVSAGTGSAGGGSITSSPDGVACTLSNAANSGTCNGAFAINTAVTLTQTPTNGSVFLNWLGACSGSGTCQLTMLQSRNVQALYRLAVPGSVTIMAGSGAGNGSVSSTPGGVACSIVNRVKSGICRAVFPVGSTVRLIATPSAGFTFTGFSGSCSGMTCTLTVPENGDLVVEANFTP